MDQEKETIALLRAKLDAEVEKAKTQFEQLKGELNVRNVDSKAELEKIKGDLIQLLCDAKVQIGSYAVEEMGKAFGTARHLIWFVIATVVAIAGLVGLGFSQIQSRVESAVSDKLNDWLSFEKKGAVLKEALESVRQKAVLDALVLRLERDGVSGRDRGPFSMNENELDRLVGYMQTCEEAEFRDGARVLAAYFGRFFPYRNARVDGLLNGVFNPLKVDNWRAPILLKSLKYYPTVGYVASQLLKEKDVPKAFAEPAFAALKNYDSDAATEYASAHLMNETLESFQIEMAKFLAHRKEKVVLVDRWIASRGTSAEKGIAAVMIADELAPAAKPFMAVDDSSGQKWAAERVASLLVDAIQHGAQIGVWEEFRSRVAIGFSFRGTTKGVRISAADYMFGADHDIFGAVAQAAEKAALPPDMFVIALTSRTKRGEVLALQIQSLGPAALVGEKVGRVDARRVAGPILLTSASGDERRHARMSFRGKDGQWVEDTVVGFEKFYRTTLRSAYDPQIVRLGSARLELDGLRD